MMLYGINGAYILLVLISLGLGLATQTFISATYKRWSQVPLGRDTTGADVARHMLQADGVEGVEILATGSSGLDDHYDPRDNTLHLSQNNMDGASVASAAVACHEAGHAVQTARDYIPGKIRSALVPIVNFASSVWMIVFILGVMLNVLGFLQLAIILFAASVIFQLVTLPVEFDASRRAIAYIRSAGYNEAAVAGSRKVLTAAALTYVSAALVSCLQLLYLMGQASSRR